jgi:hypothetical protein
LDSLHGAHPSGLGLSVISFLEQKADASGNLILKRERVKVMEPQVSYYATKSSASLMGKTDFTATQPG